MLFLNISFRHNYCVATQIYWSCRHLQLNREYKPTPQQIIIYCVSCQVAYVIPLSCVLEKCFNNCKLIPHALLETHINQFKHEWITLSINFQQFCICFRLLHICVFLYLCACAFACSHLKQTTIMQKWNSWYTYTSPVQFLSVFYMSLSNKNIRTHFNCFLSTCLCL